MPWENIGSVSTGSIPDDEAWIEFCQDLTLRYIRLVCGDPPHGAELGIVWLDHDSGSYPSLGVYSEYTPPTEYVSACEAALQAFDQAVLWSSLKEYFERSSKS